MKTKQLVLSVSVITLSLAFVVTAIAADNAGEQALREADSQWSKAAGAKDLDKTISFYSDDANVLPPNASIAARLIELAPWEPPKTSTHFSSGPIPKRARAAPRSVARAGSGRPYTR